MKRSWSIVIAAGFLLGSISVAVAGGSAWTFGDDEYLPGQIVETTTSVAWGHNADLGTPDDGPYFLYLAEASREWRQWPPDPEGTMLVGIVEITLGPFEAEDGVLHGPHGATARFEIPDIPPGEYQVIHCNDPCTTQLGDVIGGWGLQVGAGSEGRPPETIAAEVMAAIAADPLLGSADHAKHLEAQRTAARRALLPSEPDAAEATTPAPVAGLPVAPMVRTDPSGEAPTAAASVGDGATAVAIEPAPSEALNWWLAALVFAALGGALVLVRRRTASALPPVGEVNVAPLEPVAESSTPSPELAETRF